MVFTDKKGVLRQDDGEFAPDPTAADPGFDLLAAGCGATRPDTPQPPGEVPLELLASLEQEARPDTAHSVQSLTEGACNCSLIRVQTCPCVFCLLLFEVWLT